MEEKKIAIDPITLEISGLEDKQGDDLFHSQIYVLNELKKHLDAQLNTVIQKLTKEDIAEGKKLLSTPEAKKLTRSYFDHCIRYLQLNLSIIETVRNRVVEEPDLEAKA